MASVLSAATVIFGTVTIVLIVNALGSWLQRRASKLSIIRTQAALLGMVATVILARWAGIV